MFKNGYKPVNLWTKYNVAYTCRTATFKYDQLAY